MLTASTDLIVATAIVAAFAVALVWWAQRRRGSDARAFHQERRGMEAWTQHHEPRLALVEQEQLIHQLLVRERQRYAARISRQLSVPLDGAGGVRPSAAAAGGSERAAGGRRVRDGSLHQRSFISG